MAGRVSSPDLVGRVAELAELEAAVARATRGEGGLVLVAGDSGVGKTRVTAELAVRARAAGVRTLSGECFELSEGEIPFGPIVAALRRLAREMDADEYEHVLGHTRDEITRLFPELARRSDEVPDVLTIGSIAQPRLFELLLGVLERLGEQSPVLLVIEDLHWADTSTRDFLLFVARNLRDERLLVVVTYRSDELHRRHPLRPFLAQIERMPSVSRVELAPLSRDEAAEQLACILGDQPEPGVADAIYERAEGNPLFAEELLAASGSQAALPATLRDALLLRVERLSPAAQQVLSVVAAAGRRAQHGLIAEVLDLPEDELLQALRDAVSHNMLVEADDESYEFRHALVSEAVYDDLLPGERVQLHRALASALEADASLAGPGSSVDAELATHWYAAHDLDAALRASVAAGRAADCMYAFAEAERHFSRALELWDGAAGVSERECTRAELLRMTADAAHFAGDSDRAAALIRTLMDELDPETQAEEMANALVRLGRFLWLEGRGPEAVEAYHRAVDVLPPEPSVARARALAGEAQALMLFDRPADAEHRAAEALEIARAVGDRRIEANILNTLVACSAFRGDFDGALEQTHTALEIARELDLPDEVMRSYVNGGDSLDEAGRVEEALQFAFEGLAAAREMGLEKLTGRFLLAEIALRLLYLGRWDESRKVAREVLAQTGAPLALITARATDAQIAVERGEYDYARELIEQSREIVARQGGSMWIPGVTQPASLLALNEGRPELARAAIADALTTLEAENPFFMRAIYAAALRAEADIAERARPLRDDTALAECERTATSLIERFDGLLHAGGGDHRSPAVTAARASMTAEMSRLRGESDPDLWAGAAVGYDQIGESPSLAYARFRQGEALVHARAAGAAAREPLVEARAIAAGLGAAPLLAQIDALARRARLKLDAPAAEAATAPPDERVDHLGLTDREMEVLSLVAEGMTNRQIGSELFMSDKTASVHVSRILSKLGASNRAEAAASAQRLGLLDAERAP